MKQSFPFCNSSLLGANQKNTLIDGGDENMITILFFIFKYHLTN